MEGKAPDSELGTDTLLVVTIEWNTGPDGAWLAEDDHSAISHFGPFTTEAEAIRFCETCFPDDTDVRECEVERIAPGPYINPPVDVPGYIPQESL